MQQRFDSWMQQIFPRLQRKFTPITSLSFSDDGARLLFGTGAGACGFWDLTSGGATSFPQANPPQGAFYVFAPDGAHALILTTAYTTDLIALATGNKVITFDGHSDSITAAAIIPDGAFVVTGSEDRTVRLWDLASGVPLRLVDRYFDIVSSVAATPDGKSVLITTLAGDGRIVLADIEGGESHQLAELSDGAWDSTLSADGRRAAAIGGNWRKSGIWVFDLATRSEIAAMPSPQSVTQIAFAPDASFLLGAGTGNTALYLIDPLSGREMAMLQGTSGIRTLAIAPDGRLAATAGTDGTVLLWDLSRCVWLARLCLFGNGEWLVLDQAGRFDTGNLPDAARPSWGMHPALLGPLPAATSVGEFRVRGLLGELVTDCRVAGPK